MIKKDDRKNVFNLDINQLSNKKNIRSYLLEKWAEEPEGIQFRYFVEVLSNNKRIYLERPANLNKGCDFIIKVEDLILFKNGNDKPPKHSDLLRYIVNKKQHKNLKKEIESIYNCKNTNISYADDEHELILKLCKWFFIEQDITYWANSGRQMLWSEIEKIL